MTEETKRLKVCIKSPNPILAKWISSWLQEAAQGSETEKVLQKAKESLSRYPLPINSGQECAILEGFSKSLCDHIDSKMKELSAKDIANNTIENLQHQIDEAANIVNKAKEKSKKKKPVTKAKSSPQILCPIKLTMNAGNFRIWLLVDTAETSGQFKSHLDQTRAFLEEFKVAFEVRRLTIGDFAWVARNAEGKELVLPFIVERKRLDDLSSSIRDGRFHEQKHRLRNCGVPNVIYLIEYCDLRLGGLPIDNLQQAVVNTHVHSNFQTIYTKNHRQTMHYLSNLTKMLIKHFHNKNLHGSDEKPLNYTSNDIYGLLDFNYFYKDSARNSALTIRELFMQQLLQLHSLSFDKAFAIISKYPTPRILIDAFKECENECDARKLLTNICYGKLNNKIPTKLSETLYDFYFTHF